LARLKATLIGADQFVTISAAAPPTPTAKRYSAGLKTKSPTIAGTSYRLKACDSRRKWTSMTFRSTTQKPMAMIHQGMAIAGLGASTG
jgi:hypothetical protein